MGVQIDAASNDTGVDLPSSEFFLISLANWGWAGLEDGVVNTMNELPSGPERELRDRTSAVLNRKATTTTIIVGYIPCWRDSSPVSGSRKCESR